jgi:hypothetical protein
MDSGYSRHMTGDKKWFFSLTPLSHKEYVTFGDDKKGKVLSTGVIKVNDCFIPVLSVPLSAALSQFSLFFSVSYCSSYALALVYSLVD